MPPSLSPVKRAAIVRAAIEVFNESGYASASMDEVAARAGVSKRTVYNHFAGKEALFMEISTRLCHAVFEVTDKPFDPDKPVADQLMSLAMSQIRLMTSEEFLTMARVTLPERVRGPRMTNESFDRVRRGDTGLARWIEGAVAAGALRPLCARMASRQFASMLLEFCFWPQLFAGDPAPDSSEMEKVARSSVDLFLQGYRAEPPDSGP